MVRQKRGKGIEIKKRKQSIGERNREIHENNENKSNNYITDLITRLFVALLLPLGNLAVFYVVFTPLTIYLSYFLLKVFYNGLLAGNVIYLNNNNYAVEFIKPCIAGSAHYFLVLLNLLTKGIKPFERIKLFAFTSLSLVLLNVIRVLMMVIILINYSKVSFNAIHMGFWVIGSAAFVLGIWLAAVKIFKIKYVPIYSDFQELRRMMRKVKN